MIEAIQEPLPNESDKALRVWLTQRGCSILRQVVDGKCKLSQVKAHLEAHKAMASDVESFRLVASANMRDAHRYQTFLDVLDEITKQPPNEPHTIVKLK